MLYFFLQQQWATFGRMWYLYDAKWQNPFQTANKIKDYLTGNTKPIYHPLSKFYGKIYLFIHSMRLIIWNTFV